MTRTWTPERRARQAATARRRWERLTPAVRQAQQDRGRRAYWAKYPESFAEWAGERAAEIRAELDEIDAICRTNRDEPRARRAG